jgi:hypothetical protein
MREEEPHQDHLGNTSNTALDVLVSTDHEGNSMTFELHNKCQLRIANWIVPLYFITNVIKM